VKSLRGDGAPKAERSLVKDTIIGVPGVSFEVTSMRNNSCPTGWCQAAQKMCHVSRKRGKSFCSPMIDSSQPFQNKRKDICHPKYSSVRRARRASKPRKPCQWLHGPFKDPYKVTEYGERIGIGSREYELVDMLPLEFPERASMPYIAAH
jgi:hypothetical protein